MPYTPTQTVLNTRQIAANVMAYIVDNQEDAILWANDDDPLRPIKKFGDSVANRAVPVFPAMFFTDDNDSQPLDSEMLTARYSATFEVLVQSTTPDEATRQARVYWFAICSLIANIPQADLIDNTGAASGEVVGLETGFLELEANEMQNDFLQRFQIRAVFELRNKWEI
jgi:hypothetical protein